MFPRPVSLISLLDRSSGSLPMYFPFVAVTDTLCFLGSSKTWSPHSRFRMVLLSPGLISCTIFVLPGSSKKLWGFVIVEAISFDLEDFHLFIDFSAIWFRGSIFRTF